MNTIHVGTAGTFPSSSRNGRAGGDYPGSVNEERGQSAMTRQGLREIGHGDVLTEMETEMATGTINDRL